MVTCMNVVLKRFEWTWNKPHNRIGGVVSTMLSIPSSWGSYYKFYYDLIFKRCVPSHWIIIGMEKGRGYRASGYSYILE